MSIPKEKELEVELFSKKYSCYCIEKKRKFRFNLSEESVEKHVIQVYHALMGNLPTGESRQMKKGEDATLDIGDDSVT